MANPRFGFPVKTLVASLKNLNSKIIISSLNSNGERKNQIHEKIKSGIVAYFITLSVSMELTLVSGCDHKSFKFRKATVAITGELPVDLLKFLPRKIPKHLFTIHPLKNYYSTRRAATADGALNLAILKNQQESGISLTSIVSITQPYMW